MHEMHNFEEVYMGRSGGGGGGRSSGGGGGHSSGGRSSYGGRSSSSSGSSHRSFSSAGSSHRNVGGFGHHHHHHVGGFGHHHYYGGGYRRGNGASLGVIVIAIALVLFVLFVNAARPRSESSITSSTIAREPLQRSAVIETAYFTDELDWINNTTKLESGMKYFLSKTGVQPYVYITDSINGQHYPTDSACEEFGEQLYASLFRDEAHFLLLFIEYNDDYKMWYIGGNQAKTVVDNEASNIIMDYVERYYYQSELTEDEMFSNAFRDAADRMMTKTTPTSVYFIIGIVIVAVLVIAFLWWRKAKAQKNIEREQAQKILETPIDALGDNSLSDLENKYSGDS
jgi:hypothetical protein